MLRLIRRKRSVAFSGLDCLTTADFYGLFRFRLLVHKVDFGGTKTRESGLFRPFSLYF